MFPVPTPPRWALVAAGVAMLAIALIVSVLAWGRARYDAGAADADARWKAAGERLEAQAREAGAQADRREADRIDNHTAAVAAEKEKIDAAIAAGDSPLDVLFGGL